MSWVQIVTKTLTCITAAEIFLSLKITIEMTMHGTTGEVTLCRAIKSQSVLTT